MAKKDSGKVKSLSDAKIRVLYEESGDSTVVSEGVFQGSQTLFSSEDYFMILSIDGIDRLIPIHRIIHIDVLSPKYVEKDDKGVLGQYA